jgi:hypothetical protein
MRILLGRYTVGRFAKRPYRDHCCAIGIRTRDRVKSRNGGATHRKGIATHDL